MPGAGAGKRLHSHAQLAPAQFSPLFLLLGFDLVGGNLTAGAEGWVKANSSMCPPIFLQLQLACRGEICQLTQSPRPGPLQLAAGDWKF